MERIYMNTFEQMIHQLYQNEDFTTVCWVDGRKYKCICSSIGNGIMFTDAGMVDEVNFTLDLQLATLDRVPKQNDKIVFRDKQYKVSHIETDSANTTIKIYMISNSKGK